MLRTTILLLFLAFNPFIKAQSYLEGSGIELYNHYLVNPAFIANDSLVNIDAIYYNRRADFVGSPDEINIAGNVPINKINSGILLNYNRSVLGNLLAHSYGLGYAYEYQINDIVLKAGFSSAINKLSLKGIWLVPEGSNGTSDPLTKPDTKKYYLNNSYGFGFNYKGIKGGLSLIGHEVKLSGGEVFNKDASIYSFVAYNYNALYWMQLEPIISFFNEEKVEISLISTFLNNYRLGISYKFGKIEEVIGSQSKTLFTFSAGATILKHAYVNVVLNSNYNPIKSDIWGYTLLAQVGCRF